MKITKRLELIGILGSLAFKCDPFTIVMPNPELLKPVLLFHLILINMMPTLKISLNNLLSLVCKLDSFSGYFQGVSSAVEVALENDKLPRLRKIFQKSGVNEFPANSTQLTIWDKIIHVHL